MPWTNLSDREGLYKAANSITGFCSVTFSVIDANSTSPKEFCWPVRCLSVTPNFTNHSSSAGNVKLYVVRFTVKNRTKLDADRARQLSDDIVSHHMQHHSGTQTKFSNWQHFFAAAQIWRESRQIVGTEAAASRCVPNADRLKASGTENEW